MIASKAVEVRLAFAFDCPECGRENFVRAVLHEFTPEEQKKMAPDLGEKPKTGAWITHPDQVHCQHCHAEFRAINPGQEVDEKD